MELNGENTPPLTFINHASGVKCEIMYTFAFRK